jgi:hypothetical protein
VNRARGWAGSFPDWPFTRQAGLTFSLTLEISKELSMKPLRKSWLALLAFLALCIPALSALEPAPSPQAQVSALAFQEHLLGPYHSHHHANEVAHHWHRHGWHTHVFHRHHGGHPQWYVRVWRHHHHGAV